MNPNIPNVSPKSTDSLSQKTSPTAPQVKRDQKKKSKRQNKSTVDNTQAPTTQKVTSPANPITNTETTLPLNVPQGSDKNPSLMTNSAKATQQVKPKQGKKRPTTEVLYSSDEGEDFLGPLQIKSILQQQQQLLDSLQQSQKLNTQLQQQLFDLQAERNSDQQESDKDQQDCPSPKRREKFLDLEKIVDTGSIPMEIHEMRIQSKVSSITEALGFLTYNFIPRIVPKPLPDKWCKEFDEVLELVSNSALPSRFKSGDHFKSIPLREEFKDVVKWGRTMEFLLATNGDLLPATVVLVLKGIMESMLEKSLYLKGLEENGSIAKILRKSSKPDRYTNVEEILKAQTLHNQSHASLPQFFRQQRSNSVPSRKFTSQGYQYQPTFNALRANSAPRYANRSFIDTNNRQDKGRVYGSGQKRV